MAPPPLFFQLGFYLGALAFAVAVILTAAAGGSIDAGVFRGVQALLSFMVLGWIAELVVDSAPVRPAAAREQPRPEPALRTEEPAMVEHSGPMTEASDDIDELQTTATMPIPLRPEGPAADDTETLGGSAQAA